MFKAATCLSTVMSEAVERSRQALTIEAKRLWSIYIMYPRDWQVMCIQSLALNPFRSQQTNAHGPYTAQ